jgi:hypothetical protein
MVPAGTVIDMSLLVAKNSALPPSLTSASNSMPKGKSISVSQRKLFAIVIPKNSPGVMMPPPSSIGPG